MTASPNASLFTYPRFMALNTEGYPLAGGNLYSYQAGTLTPQATYTDATLTVPNPNPIILDAFGTAAVWLGSSSYKFNLLDANGVQQADFPIDNVIGYAQVSAATVQASAATVLADLASTAAGQGAALVGYHPGGNPSGSVGMALDNEITSSNLVNQTFQAFTTGGTGSAYTLTPPVALASNASLTRYNVTFAAAGSGSPTMAVSGLTALPLMAYNSVGGLTAYLPVLNQVSDVQCNGTNWIVLDPLGDLVPPVPPKSSRSNLQASTTGLSSVTTITADALTLVNANGNGLTGTGLALTNTLTAGNVANGLDTGPPAYSTWYYIFAIYNPTTATFATIASLSSTSPTLPSGYTFKALVSAIRTQAATNYYPLRFNQAGTDVEYAPAASSNLINYPTMISGTSGNPATPTLTAVPIAGFVPSNVAKIKVMMSVNYGTGQCGAGPASYYSATAQIPLLATNGSSGATDNTIGEFIIQSSNFYYASSVSGGSSLCCLGFSMNL
jgi:hypothetical protein